MKLRELIERFDKEITSTTFPTEKLFSELRLDGDWWEIELEDHGFTAFQPIKWLCTDTWVGLEILFYQDEPFAVTWQPARKSPTEFHWIGGREKYAKILEICAKLIPLPELGNFQEADLDEEIEEGYQVSYYTQLLADKVRIKETGQIVDVVRRSFEERYKKEETVTIRDENGARTIPMKDVIVPYPLKVE